MKKLIMLLVLSLIFTISASAQETSTKRKAQFNLEESSLAIQGYDPVAYFINNKAVEGKKDIATVYNGITYRFSSVKNRDLFKATPAKYEPQYGGWCAFAMGSVGKKVEINPNTFKIVDNKLYLFYNKYFNNTLTSWNKDQANLKTNADRNWVKVTK